MQFCNRYFFNLRWVVTLLVACLIRLSVLHRILPIMPALQDQSHCSMELVVSGTTHNATVIRSWETSHAFR